MGPHSRPGGPSPVAFSAPSVVSSAPEREVRTPASRTAPRGGKTGRKAQEMPDPGREVGPVKTGTRPRSAPERRTRWG